MPLFILLYEWFFLQDLSFTWLRKRFLPILGVGVFLVCVVMLFPGQHPLDAILNSYGSRDFNMEQRVLTEFRVVLFYFKAENLVLRARSESVGFAEIVNKDRMVGTKAQSKNQKTILNNKLK